MTDVTYAYFKSKDEEQAFLMTGSDIGFTKWDNELKETLLRAPLTFRQYKVFDAIHRLTIGWNKQYAHIENTRIGKMTAIHHTHVSKVRKELENMNMIFKHNNEVSINQNYHEWSFNKSLAETANKVKPNQQGLAKIANDNETLAKTANKNKPNQLNITELANGCQNSYTLAETANMSLAKSANESLAESAKHKRKERNILKHKPPQTPPLAKSKSFDPSLVELPAWLPKPIWDSWVQYRKEINKPIKSQQTVTQAIKLLGKCRDNGHQPEEIINTSIANGWHGLFEPHQPARTQQTNPQSVADNFSSKDYGTTQIPDWARDCL
ncbi:MAG: replication protein [Symbiopectobacterium sp.]|uniref:replication protein n=1 Tax=Symbiopectobacterium sp. TaxID=2952789 RepID=UPI0039ECEDE0